MYKKIFILLVAFLTIISPLKLSAENNQCPVERINNLVDNTINILNEPDKGLPQLKKLYKTSSKFFDKEKIALFVLGSKWNGRQESPGKKEIQGFTPEEKKEFQNKFLYMVFTVWYNKLNQEQERQKTKISIHYPKTENVIYQTRRSGERLAVVKTNIERNSEMIPVDYFLTHKDGRWLVYDIAVEGVRLARNYNRQLRKYFRKPPRHIITKLDQKITKLESEI